MDEMAARTWLWLLLSPLILLLLHYALALLTACQARKNPLPPSPPALPFIGHLHLIGALPHVSLCRLATKHAPDLMFLRLGTSLPVLVASSPRAAEAILRTHDDVFASRPRTVLADIIFYGSRDIGFAPYGEDWRQARKLVNTHLLSVNKVQSLWLAREEEVKVVMEKISKAAFAREAVDIGQILCSFTNDLACRVVSRKLVGDDRQKKLLQELVNKTIKLLSIFNVEEYFSILARIGVIGKVMCARAERLKKRWDMLLKKLIDDHESKCDSYLVCGRNKDDFVDILLSVRKEYGLTEEHVKAILEDVFIAGTQSSARVIEFTFAELMRKPHMLKKVQDEVRASIPNGQAIVSEVQVNNMTYLRAVVKEVLRLHPVAPLLATHVSMADCNIDGYMIPSGMRVLVNAWAIGRDERFWDDPEKFMPERFVESVNGSATASVNFWVNNYQYLPFGSGRRMCLGMNFAMAVIEITLANLLWKFDWALPAHAMEVDMSEEFGLSVRLKEKLLLVPKQHV
ncbi:indole-2-monooxygenase-like isoform X2 [Oryza glaberrima]|uniref:Cytochrome P450 n=1 Tax=Oryza glaberrima TaxID=4538 RepID=I1R020_ORYGL|nr:indole-2-monooxygenase-like isoform X2 [Oryza glaberrima]